MKSYQINVKKCLIIPDVHQDVEWVMSILEKEKGNYVSSRVITLIPISQPSKFQVLKKRRVSLRAFAMEFLAQ
jgi:hypothetical protein